MTVLQDFYTVKTLESDHKTKLVFSVQIDKNHPIYKGHFPNFKVTPGVVMLQILKNVLEQEVSKQLLMQKASQIKFLSLVEPEVNTILNFEVSLTFEAEKILTKCVVSFPNDTIVLKCNATFVIK